MDLDTFICLIIIAGLVVFCIYMIKYFLDSLAKRNKEREEARTIGANIRRVTDTQGRTDCNANHVAEKALIKNCHFYREEYTAMNKVTYKAHCEIDNKPCSEFHCQELGHPLPQYCDKFYKQNHSYCPFLSYRYEDVECKTDIEEFKGTIKVSYCELSGKKFGEWVESGPYYLKDSKGNDIPVCKKYDDECKGCSKCVYFQSTKLTPPNK